MLLCHFTAEHVLPQCILQKLDMLFNDVANDVANMNVSIRVEVSVCHRVRSWDLRIKPKSVRLSVCGDKNIVISLGFLYVNFL